MMGMNGSCFSSIPCATRGCSNRISHPFSMHHKFCKECRRAHHNRSNTLYQVLASFEKARKYQPVCLMVDPGLDGE